jgi:hypothetical protein
MDEIDYKEFVKAVSQSASEVAQQIVSDREREREQMISASVLNVKDVVVKESKSGNITGPGLTPKEMRGINVIPSVFSGPQLGLSHGGRKTRRRKRTRKSKKSMHKKTRKRRQ